MQQEDFKISGIVWHEVGKRSIDLSNRLVSMLNLNLHLKQYGEVLDWFGLIHIIDIQDIYKPYKRHSKKKKYLYVRYKLDYDQFVKANDEEALEMMALSFLEVIESFPKWKIKDFDWQALHADARKLFLEHRFIREKTPSIHANP